MMVLYVCSLNNTRMVKQCSTDWSADLQQFSNVCAVFRMCTGEHMRDYHGVWAPCCCSICAHSKSSKVGFLLRLPGKQVILYGRADTCIFVWGCACVLVYHLFAPIHLLNMQFNIIKCSQNLYYYFHVCDVPIHWQIMINSAYEKLLRKLFEHFYHVASSKSGRLSSDPQQEEMEKKQPACDKVNSSISLQVMTYTRVQLLYKMVFFGWTSWHTCLVELEEVEEA